MFTKQFKYAIININYNAIRKKEGKSFEMKEIFFIMLFLMTLLIGGTVARVLTVRVIKFGDKEASSSAPETEEMEDPKIFWKEKGFCRDFEKEEAEIPQEDFFENEKTELPESFDEEFEGLGEEEIAEILEKAGIFEEGGADGK